MKVGAEPAEEHLQLVAPHASHAAAKLRHALQIQLGGEGVGDDHRAEGLNRRAFRVARADAGADRRLMEGDADQEGLLIPVSRSLRCRGVDVVDLHGGGRCASEDFEIVGGRREDPAGDEQAGDRHAREALGELHLHGPEVGAGG